MKVLFQRIVTVIAAMGFLGGCFPLYGPCEPWPMGLNCLLRGRGAQDRSAEELKAYCEREHLTQEECAKLGGVIP